MKTQQPESTGPLAPAEQRSARKKRPLKGPGKFKRRNAYYAALDLGTNNCRLLIAEPTNRGFRVIDAFSRIVRLGEGLSHTGRLSDEAIARTLSALKVCQEKLKAHENVRKRLIATEACRRAENGPEFIRLVEERLGLKFEIIDGETEAQLAVKGCASLIDKEAEAALVFDIGGGSTELIWVDFQSDGPRGALKQKRLAHKRVASWASMPVGVVSLAERHGGVEVTPQTYAAMVDDVESMLSRFEGADRISKAIAEGRAFHFLGTSGTVTTLAGVHLDLPKYDRRRVDGQWMSREDVRSITDRLIGLSYQERRKVPCIGTERADLVLAGCAILDAIWRLWPAERLRVADRGLREGVLNELMAPDGFGPLARRRSRKPKRRKMPRQAVRQALFWKGPHDAQ